MTILLAVTGASVTNTDTVTGAPAFRIAAADIRFINTERGRIMSTADNQAAITIDATGSTLINDLGGIIGSFGFETLAVQGSAGRDTIMNAGLISGRVALGDGDDDFTQQTSGTSTPYVMVDLEAGNDRFTLDSGSSDQYHLHRLDGGSGDDTLVLAGAIGLIYANDYGAYTRGFEHLEVGAAVTNISGLSNFLTVTLAPGGRNNFLASANPDADLAMAGGFVTINRGSSFRNVTGSDAAEQFELGSGINGFGALLGSADLGGGDDFFWLTADAANVSAPVIGGSVNGGDGTDTVHLASDAAHTFDLAKLIGFERINTGTFSSVTSMARVINLNNYLQVTGDGGGGTLTIAQSNSPDAAVHVSSKGILVLESTATIGRYGFPTGPGWETDFDGQRQGNNQFNVTVINNGTILGAVQLYYGDDLYDGRGGTAGGTVFGYAGSDRLYGGFSDDRLDGGFGADDLSGGNGNDTLIGGGGADSLDGGDGDDRIFGETATLLFDTGLGVDTLLGGGGDDVLAAGFGDTVDGGDGNDGLLLNLAAGAVAANLDLAAAFAGGTTTGPGGSFTGIERYGYVIGTGFGDAISIGDGILDAALVFDSTRPGVSGGDGADRLIGGANADRLYGDGGRDILFGLGGDDLLDAGIGNDQLYGGAGDDIYFAEGFDLVFEIDGEGTDTIEARSDFYLFANVENLRLAEGVGSAFGVGNALANDIQGNEGDNLLIAQGGNDIVFGRDGNDTIYGQAGDDQLEGDDGIDYIVGGNGNDTLDGDSGADALYGEAGDDVLIGGSSFDTDILVGGNGNDLLFAASGLGDYDLIDGGAGNDTYYVDTPADLTFEALAGGIDTVHADINGAGYYLYANTENLILEGNTPFGVGNELANQLTGNALSNYLLGGQGNDTLNGKAGNDVLFGEAGADLFVFERGTGGDVIGDFQAGVDKIQLTDLGFTTYAELSASFVEVAGTTAINLGQGDLIVLNGIANAALSAADFILG